MGKRGRPQIDPAGKCIKVSVSMTPEMLEWLKGQALDDQGRELKGGVSGVLRDVVESYREFWPPHHQFVPAKHQ